MDLRSREQRNGSIDQGTLHAKIAQLSHKRDTLVVVASHGNETLGAQVPTLYKQYVELCEPGGARFLAFGVDPGFSDAVDGLIEVDIQRMRPKKRQRYLGGDAASSPAVQAVG